MRQMLVLAVLAAALVGGTAARADSAECVRDAECGDDLICEAGACVAPPARPAEPAASTAEPPAGEPLVDAPAPAPSPDTEAAADPDEPAAPPPVTAVAPIEACPPDAAPDVVAAPETADVAWLSKYATVAGLWGFFGWGELYDQQRRTVRLGVDTRLPDDVTEVTWSAFQMTGLGAFNENLHLGGFFTYHGMERDRSAVSFGLTAKLGGRVDDRIWLGVALDAGMLFWVRDGESYEDYWGVVVFPRFHVDVLAIQGRGDFKLGFFAAIGPHFVPYTAGTMLEVDPGVDVEFSGWNATLTGLMGMSLGG